LREQIREKEETIENLKNQNKCSDERIESLEKRNEELGKELASYARMMSPSDDYTGVNIEEELKKTKANLVAQMSHVSILSNEVQRLEKEVFALRKKLSSEDDSAITELKQRYNFVEKKLALLCSRHNELPDDPVTIETINSIQNLEETNQLIAERYFISFVSQIKYQKILQGELCVVSALQMYEEAKTLGIKPIDYGDWIKTKLNSN